MEDQVIYRFYESEIVKVLEDVGIEVNEETLPKAIDVLADYLNQTMKFEIASYLESVKEQILGNEE